MRRMRPVLVLLVLATLAAGLAHAGTISIAWDPVSDADVAGYKVYWGTSSRTYTHSKDVGNVTSTTLTDLDPCTRYYIAVKAYDTGGLESDAYSDELVGLPRPVVRSTSPSSGDQGERLTVAVKGESFDDGATVEFSGEGIAVLATRFVSCTELSVDIEIAADAPTGARNVTVTNPDRSFGTGVAVFTVNAADTEGPSVTGTDPADGATGIDVDVHPRVFFSEPLDPASVTPETVQLLDPDGNRVAQASGSPALSADGKTVTITPARSLAERTRYRVRVIGGANGVKDRDGNPMDSTWTQPTGFTTENLPPGNVSGLRRSDVH